MPRPSLPLLSLALSLFLTLLLAPTQAQAERYIKIGNNGQELPADAALGSGPTDWACTGDTQTGLMWEVKVDDPDHLRHKDHGYTWYFTDSPDGYPGASGTTDTCGNTLNGQNCNTETYAAAVNSVGLCGFNSWRVPSYDENFTLFKSGLHPSINSDYFPNTKSSCYWSSTENSNIWACCSWFGDPDVDPDSCYNTRAAIFPLRIVSNEQPLFSFGELIVIIEPFAANNAGGQWRRVGSDTWRDSGVTEIDVPVGTHTVEFKEVDGWTTPQNVSVTVVEGETATATGTYIQETGAIRVNIEPAGARDAGAQWRRVGAEFWRNSGATESNVSVGTHTIEFNNVENWTKPLNFIVNVSKDQTSTATVTYTIHDRSSYLFGIGYNEEIKKNELRSIDLSTGATNLLNSFEFDTNHWQPPTFNVDLDSGHAYAISSGSTLYKIGLESNDIISTVSLDTYFQAVKFGKQGHLLGITYNSEVKKNELYSINL